MNRQIYCPHHGDFQICFISITKGGDDTLKCAKCVSDSSELQQILSIQQINESNETSIFKTWPPMTKESVREEIKNIINIQENHVQQINDYFDTLLQDTTQWIQERRKQVLIEANILASLKEKMRDQYIKLNGINQLKDFLNNNLVVSELGKKLQGLITEKYDICESSTLMLENMINYYKSIQITEENQRSDDKQSIQDKIKDIKFFYPNQLRIIEDDEEYINQFKVKDNFESIISQIKTLVKIEQQKIRLQNCQSINNREEPDKKLQEIKKYIVASLEDFTLKKNNLQDIFNLFTNLNKMIESNQYFSLKLEYNYQLKTSTPKYVRITKNNQGQPCFSISKLSQILENEVGQGIIDWNLNPNKKYQITISQEFKLQNSVIKFYIFTEKDKRQKKLFKLSNYSTYQYLQGKSIQSDKIQSFEFNISERQFYISDGNSICVISPSAIKDIQIEGCQQFYFGVHFDARYPIQSTICISNLSEIDQFRLSL